MTDDYIGSRESDRNILFYPIDQGRCIYIGQYRANYVVLVAIEWLESSQYYYISSGVELYEWGVWLNAETKQHQYNSKQITLLIMDDAL